MGYYIDLRSISLEKYKEILKNTDLIPSWKVLEKDIDENLNILIKQNVKNLDELLITLKDKDKIQEFANLKLFSRRNCWYNCKTWWFRFIYRKMVFHDEIPNKSWI